MLDSDWLPTTFRFSARAECVRQCIKKRNGNRQCVSIGYSVFAVSKDREWVHIQHCGTFSKFFSAPTTARTIITAATDKVSCG